MREKSARNFKTPFRLILCGLAATLSFIFSADCHARFERGVDIRNLAPPKPVDKTSQAIAIPSRGTDMASIGSDWAQKQKDLLLGEAEKKLVDDFNENLATLFYEPKLGESVIGERPGARRQPSSVRMTAINRMEVSLSEFTKLTCTATGSDFLFRLRQPLMESVHLDLNHQTGSGKSYLNFNYQW